MTSRERVLKAVNFEEPDRVPIDFGGMRSTGIMASAYHRLKQYLGIEGGHTRVYDTGQMLAMVEEPILQRFGIDVIPLEGLGTADEGDDSQWKSWTLPDGTPVEMPLNIKVVMDEEGNWLQIDAKGRVQAKMPKGGFYFDGVPTATAEKPKVEDFRVGRISEEELECLEQRSRLFYENTDYALLGGSYAYPLLNMGLGGFNEWLCTMLTDKPYVHAVLHKAVEDAIVNLRLYHQAVGDRAFALTISDDLGTQKAEWIRPELFAELIAPYYKALCDWVHEHTNYKIFLHTCGSIYYIIETLIDCGIDIFNPVQTSADNMEPTRLKREFGGRIVFWGGGCETQSILPFGTPEEVQQQVKERIEMFAPGGGFVFNQIHNVQANTPPENIVAMLEAAMAFGASTARL